MLNLTAQRTSQIEIRSGDEFRQRRCQKHNGVRDIVRLTHSHRHLPVLQESFNCAIPVDHRQ
jgi:hypothetical protein